jgi:hypothetical protein
MVAAPGMIRVERSSLKEYGGGRIEQRSVGNVRVTGNPANISCTPVDILILLQDLGALTITAFVAQSCNQATGMQEYGMVWGHLGPKEIVSWDFDGLFTILSFS